jgi:hypothetical protein
MQTRSPQSNCLTVLLGIAGYDFRWASSTLIATAS